MTLNWEKGLFTSKYELFHSDEKIGEISEGAFSKTAIARLNDRGFKFQKKGVFNSETQITDSTQNKSFGTIKFNAWGTKAELAFDNKKYYWKYENIWGTKWSINHMDEKIIEYSSSNTKGQINTTTESELLILAGLFIHNYYVQIMMVIVVSMIVMFF